MSALKTLLGSYWLWLAVFAAGVGAGGYVMYGQVQDARSSASAAQAQAREAKGQAEELGKSLALVLARQAQTDASLAARKRQEAILLAQLKGLNSDLDRAFKNDQPSSVWGAGCVPDAVADRLHLPADPDCAGARPAP